MNVLCRIGIHTWKEQWFGRFFPITRIPRGLNDAAGLGIIWQHRGYVCPHCKVTKK